MAPSVSSSQVVFPFIYFLSEVCYFSTSGGKFNYSLLYDLIYVMLAKKKKANIDSSNTVIIK